MLVFLAGSERFALPVSAIEAVIDMPTVRRLPVMPDGMLGVTEHRGALVSVYSAARALNVAIDAPDAALVARTAGPSADGRGRRVVIAVGAVEGVLAFESSAWTGVGGAAPGAGLVRGVAARAGVLTTLVDAATFLDACCGRCAPEKVEPQKVESREPRQSQALRARDVRSGSQSRAREGM